MIIPNGVDYKEFLKQATEKGIKIRSRYVGVCFNINGGKPCWLARIQTKNKLLFSKRFPFTEQGEKQASLAYTTRIENTFWDYR